MTNSGRWEVWKAGDGFAVRHCVGHHDSKQEADKQWKRLTLFAPAKEAAKYELLEPTVKQQLELRERTIAAKGHAQPLPPRKSFSSILMEKIDSKKKQYVWKERQERENPHLSYRDEKLVIEGGLRALKWAHQAYLESTQQELELVK